MEETRYPQLNEEQGQDMACEPVAAPVADYDTVTTRHADGTVEVHDWIDDLDWSKFPSYGPFSEEEAIARIDQFEEELAKGQVTWISSEQAWAQIYEKFPWLR